MHGCMIYEAKMSEKMNERTIEENDDEESESKQTNNGVKSSKLGINSAKFGIWMDRRRRVCYNNQQMRDWNTFNFEMIKFSTSQPY